MTTNTPSPAITAYLERLARGLKSLPADERDDVLREIGAHLEDGLAAGQDPDALLARMGPAEEVAEALVSERMRSVDQRRTPLALASMVARAAGVPFLVTFSLYVALMVGNSIYLYAELIAQSRVGVGTVVGLMLFNLPAILVVTLPIAALMTGLTALPKLATLLSPGTLKRLYPRLAAAGLMAGLVLSLAGFALNDGLVPVSNRMTVDLVRQFMLNQSPSPESTRSPQELSLAELDRRLAERRTERDRQATDGATYQAIAERDKALRLMEVDRHLKLALPAYSFSLMAIGLAFGTLLARRRPVPMWLSVGLAIVAVAAIYTAMNLARFSEAFSGSPALAAWSPVGLTLLVAAAVWALAKITQKGVYADV
ncbi:MAG: LptF/LptG family permease [Candidatus Sericytochromatia bacterium]